MKNKIADGLFIDSMKGVMMSLLMKLQLEEDLTKRHECAKMLEVLIENGCSFIKEVNKDVNDDDIFHYLGKGMGI